MKKKELERSSRKASGQRQKAAESRKREKNSGKVRWGHTHNQTREGGTLYSSLRTINYGPKKRKKCITKNAARKKG